MYDLKFETNQISLQRETRKRKIARYKHANEILKKLCISYTINTMMAILL